MATQTQHKTRNHDEIKKWAEERNAKPAVVQETEQGKGAGLLRFKFPQSENNFKEISWDEFFNTFDEKNLDFIYQDETAKGEKSWFFKFIERE